MKRAALLLTLLLLPLFAVAEAEAPKRNSEEMLRSCQQAVKWADSDNQSMNFEQNTQAAECLGYVHGVYDVLKFEQLTLNLELPMPGIWQTCLPSDVTAGQLARVMVKWLSDHPEKLNEPIQWHAVFILHDAFPCTPKPTAAPVKGGAK